MTPEERQQQREQRDAAICAFYGDNHSLTETSRHFRIGKQRVMQILKAGGVWRPYVKSNRTHQLGIVVSEETKKALHERAEEEGTSVSRLGSKVLDEFVKKEDKDGITSSS